MHPDVVRVSPDFSDLPQRLKEEEDKTKKYCYHFFTSEQLQVQFKDTDLKVIKFERAKPHPNNLFSKPPTAALDDVLKRPTVGFAHHT
jgi:hypothetical protein